MLIHEHGEEEVYLSTVSKYDTKSCKSDENHIAAQEKIA
jgi:hypothetical protein